MGCRWLITGGAGFIGSNFVRYLLRTHPEDTVATLDKLTYAGNRENLRDLDGHPRHQWILGDIAAPAVVEPLVRECDAVVNFAAESHVDRSIVDPATFLQTNVIGTQVLLQAAARARPPAPWFVQVSTDEVYGSTAGDPFREDSPLRPNSPYAASKAAADLFVQAYAATYGVPVVITRSSNNYGPYQHPEKLIPLAITRALEDAPIPLYGDGLNVRDWLHVEDNCAAIDQVIARARQGGLDGAPVVNIGAGAGETNRAVLEMILGIMKKPVSLIQPVPDRPGHDRRYAVATGRLERLTGWRPRRAFARGLEDTVAWYRAHEQWWRPLKQRVAPHWLTTTKGTPCGSSSPG